MSNLTFGIIKPDAVRKGHAGKIIDRILSNGFKIRGMKLIHQSLTQSEGFYAVHAERPFFSELTEFIKILRVRSVKTPFTARIPTKMQRSRSLISLANLN